jgi:hypothetical protein
VIKYIRILLSFAAIFLVAAAIACNDDGDEENPDAFATDAPAGEETPEPTPRSPTNCATLPTPSRT